MAARLSTLGKRVTISADFRREPGRPGDPQTAQWQAIPDVTAFLNLVQAIAGPDVDVFFDFGVVSVRNVDLGRLRSHMEGAG